VNDVLVNNSGGRVHHFNIKKKQGKNPGQHVIRDWTCQRDNIVTCANKNILNEFEKNILKKLKTSCRSQ